ncbi:hypothetical protein GDO81_022103 [Engystomops pustulosus]|uniref:ribonuclease H n=1 Tax=Engystomops pustulosus TaxID=76066 RepID=A0AAV6YV23_ENGPU|nr:hypothetical protein GDO81_022103 [Engystomops pustulosus]KAG8538771.1 hypothetical protein GDO81_022103 [Engystomops pustulosus]KAG8538772.1 hypothetical protein GDO81_022103 [Engystomops pustulosus]KAG8538773.1 hypothetical protein GDO81_022103 [Engystomops pustulosus]
MESVRTATQLIHTDSYMCTLDLKDAYYHVPIHPSSQRFLRFSVLSPEGSVLHFQFRALPFGISSAPRVFTKIMVEVVAFLRLQDISIIPYLDDLLIIGKDKQKLILARESSLRILTELGWLINLKKSSLVPSTRKTFLGIILDSTHQMSFLPQEKISNIKHQIRSFRRKDSVPVRQAMKILGLLTACLPAVAWSQSHTRILQNWILTFWNRKSSGLDKKIRIPSFVKRDLLWWMELRNLEKGVCWHHLPTITIVTDASSSGWGAILPSHYEQGSWTLAQAKNSSNYRELRAVWEALRSNTAYLRDHHIHILSDNVSTVSYLRRQGGTRSPVLSSLARTIFQWAEENILSISATHLKGSLNREADYLSRREILPNEWCLNQEIFLHLTSVWGMPQIDLFATRENSKCQQYFSLEAGESRDHLDAFSHRWSGSLMYAFPPIPLIARVLRKILLDRSRVILICPNWPKRSWYPLLRSLSVQQPFILPIQKDLLYQGPIFHPDPGRLRLAAWILSSSS